MNIVYYGVLFFYLLFRAWQLSIRMGCPWTRCWWVCHQTYSLGPKREIWLVMTWDMSRKGCILKKVIYDYEVCFSCSTYELGFNHRISIFLNYIRRWYRNVLINHEMLLVRNLNIFKWIWERQYIKTLRLMSYRYPEIVMLSNSPGTWVWFIVIIPEFLYIFLLMLGNFA